MEFMPKQYLREESDAVAARIKSHFQERGFGLWAVEIPGESDFIGFVGLTTPIFEAHFTPCVEVGWRLAYEHWGRGYATEAAAAALDDGFGRLNLQEIVAMTTAMNVRSLRVMEKLGMTCSRDDDFDHPKLAEGHPLRRHVLYRLTRSDWQNKSREMDATRGYQI
jgi:RimJ/RimL family protein N-acetyltransferase